MAIAGVVTAIVVAAVAGSWIAKHRVTPTSSRPNVLFVVWDTTRADRMSLYGNPRPTTPRIQAFAKTGVVYDRAYAADMWTMPTHASLFTGLPTTSHGVTTDWRWLDSSYLTLPEFLGENGWETYGFTANQFASQNCNLFQGMDSYDTVWEGRYAKDSKAAMRRKRIPGDASTEISPLHVQEPGEPNKMWDRGLFKDAAPVAHQAVVDWIDQRPDPSKPWFAFINMMEAHWPRVPSMKARQQVLDPDLLQRGLTTDATLFTAEKYNLRVHEETPEELEAQVGVYDAALVDLDNATADLLDDLDHRGLLENTIVVLTADHGEYLGDHHMFDHRYGLYDSVTHVPLVIRYPPKLTPHRVTTPVTTAGIWTTVAELAGLTVPNDGWQRGLLDETRPGPVFSEYPIPDDMALASLKRQVPQANLAPFFRTLDAVVDGSLKLLSYTDHADPELYDVLQDPGETHNLAGDRPADVAKLQGELDTWKKSLKPNDPARRLPTDKPRQSTAKERQQLCALGYLECDGDGEDAAGNDDDGEGENR
jgi:arylsulfatase A-like enzyme